MNGVIAELAELTGMSPETLKAELSKACDQAGVEIERASLDEIRLVMARYLHEVLESEVFPTT